MRIFLIGAALVACSTITLAQEAKQTPGNAHKFLLKLGAENRIALVLPEQYRRVTWYSTSGYNNRYTVTSHSNDYPVDFWFNPPSSAGCKTDTGQYRADDPAFEQGDGQYERSMRITVPAKKTERPYIYHLQSLNRTGIDWSKVTGVDNNNSRDVTIRSSFLSGGQITLRFDSADMAARAAYALEIIRLSCDSVADTGF